MSEPQLATASDSTTQAAPPPTASPARLRSGRAYLLIVGIGALLGLLLRVPLIFGSSALFNADEAITGLMARHIADGTLYFTFPGQYYQGTLEAYTVALVTPLLGASAATLKLVVALWWGAAFLVVDRAAVVLAGTIPGLTFAIAWCSASLMIDMSTLAYTGWGAGLVFAALALLAWAHARRQPERYQRWILVSGLCSGAAIWQQPTFLGLALAYGALVWIVGAWPRIRATLWLTLGGILGASPLILLNIRYGGAGLHPLPQPPTTYLDRLELVVTGLLPRVTGVMTRPGQWVVPHALVLVLVTALAVAIVLFVRADRPWPHSPLVVPVVMIVVAVFAIAIFPTTWFVADARYGSSFVIPLALLGGLLVQRLAARGRWRAAVPVAVGAATLAIALHGLDKQHMLELGEPHDDASEVTRVLQAHGLRCATGQYWAVEPYAYLAGDGVLAESDGPVRFFDERNAILAAPGRYAYLHLADATPVAAPPGFAAQPIRAGSMLVFLPAPIAPSTSRNTTC